MPPLTSSEDDRVTEFASREPQVRHRDRAQFRPTAAQKELLVRAATLTGQSLSDFMRTAVEERARRVISDHERIILTENASAAFIAALANPPQPNDRLVALLERYAREVESRP